MTEAGTGPGQTGPASEAISRDRKWTRCRGRRGGGAGVPAPGCGLFGAMRCSELESSDGCTCEYTRNHGHAYFKNKKNEQVSGQYFAQLPGATQGHGVRAWESDRPGHLCILWNRLLHLFEAQFPHL